MPLQIGDSIKGIYKIIDIKYGGTGTIYIGKLRNEKLQKAEGKWLDQEALEEEKNEKENLVAFKTLHSDYFLVDSNKESFMNEATIWTTIPNHPYIIKCFAIDTFLDSSPSIFLEYARNGNLRNFVNKENISQKTILTIALQFCVGINFLNSNYGIIHGDIKPENILIDNEGQVKITDFGLSVNVSNFNSKTHLKLKENSTNFIKGTLPYMSPESFDKPSKDIESDIYSFGIVLYELIMGHLPFKCNSFEEFENAHKNKTVDFDQNNSVPKDLIKIIDYCLQKRPENRYRNFLELKTDIENYIKSSSIEINGIQDPTINELESNYSDNDWNSRGYSYAKIGQFKKSLECYLKALEISPKLIGLNSSVGVAYKRLGNYTEAEIYYKKEISYHPKLSIAYRNLGIFYLDQNNITLAKETFKYAVKCEDCSISILRELSFIYFHSKEKSNFQKTIDRIKQRMENDPENYGVNSWTNEGIQYGLIGFLEVAESFFKRGNDLFNNNSEAVN